MIRHKFLIGDVLKKVTTKKLPLKAKTLPKITNGDKSLVPLMAAGVENQGCVGYVNPNEPTVLHNLITVSANGANSGATFYQQRKFSILQDAYALELVDKYADYASDNVYLYLTAVVDHRLKDNGYNNKATWNRIKNYYIELPVTPAGDPDFEYMTMRICELEDDRICELEDDRIRELEAYLRVTGLNDITLSTNEAQALTKTVKWKKFKIGDYFDIEKVRGVNKSGLTSPTDGESYDYITRTSQNNGIESITGKVSNRELNEAGSISLGLLQMTFFYRDRQWYAGQFVRKIVPKVQLTKEQTLYFVTLFNALRPKLIDILVRSVDNVFLNTEVELPVTPDDQIDFDYMQNYIRATEKQTIKGVVEYKDRVIAETKKVVND